MLLLQYEYKGSTTDDKKDDKKKKKKDKDSDAENEDDPISLEKESPKHEKRKLSQQSTAAERYKLLLFLWFVIKKKVHIQLFH